MEFSGKWADDTRVEIFLKVLAQKCFGGDEAASAAWWETTVKEVVEEFRRKTGSDIAGTVSAFLRDLRDAGVDERECVALCGSPAFMDLLRLWREEVRVLLKNRLRVVISEKLAWAGEQLTDEEVEVLVCLIERDFK